MPKVRLMFNDNVENPMFFGVNADMAILEEFDYLPRIGELVYWDDLFLKVIAVYHEPLKSINRQTWATTIVLKHPCN